MRSVTRKRFLFNNLQVDSLPVSLVESINEYRYVQVGIMANRRRVG